MKKDFIKKYLKDLGFDLDIEKYAKTKTILEECAIENDIDGMVHYMEQCQNCGGYALQIPNCIFSIGDTYSFEENVLRIMELYPFVRLLSNTELKENEYLVLFRAGKTGHHFIRIDDKGNAIEKHECNLPQKFQSWGTLEHDPEAVFAVIKPEYRSEEIDNLPQCNRDMFLNLDAYYQIEEDGYKDIMTKEAVKPHTFNNEIQQCYKDKRSSFVYNNKTFFLKTNKEEPDIIYICDEDNLLGQLYTDGNEFLIELNDEMKNRIFGFQPSKQLDVLKKLKINEFER